MEFPKQPDGHYYVPIAVWITNEKPGPPPVVAFLDTGATNCLIPKAFNDTVLNLPVAGHDDNVKTATAPTGYDFVIVPKISLLSFILTTGNTLTFQTVGLDETNVKAWLGESFVIGMNLISAFDVCLMRKNLLAIER